MEYLPPEIVNWKTVVEIKTKLVKLWSDKSFDFSGICHAPLKL